MVYKLIFSASIFRFRINAQISFSFILYIGITITRARVTADEDDRLLTLHISLVHLVNDNYLFTLALLTWHFVYGASDTP